MMFGRSKVNVPPEIQNVATTIPESQRNEQTRLREGYVKAQVDGFAHVFAPVGSFIVQSCALHSLSFFSGRRLRGKAFYNVNGKVYCEEDFLVSRPCLPDFFLKFELWNDGRWNGSLPVRQRRSKTGLGV